MHRAGAAGHHLPILQTSLFDYELPRELIAAEPAQRRDESRLLVLNRANQSIAHHVFRDLPGLLCPGDLMVFNDSKVLPARLHGHRAETGGAVELLLLERCAGAGLGGPDRWIAIGRPARKLKPGAKIIFGQGRLAATVMSEVTGSEREVEFDVPDVMPALADLGEIPLPPYIIQRRREQGMPELTSDDAERYQTIYAREAGSVAAPTAGLHFTDEVMAGLEARGIERTAVTLHVGPGTFRPVETEDTSDHPMHTEHFEISEAAAQVIHAARTAGRRVVTVGTTAVRAVESGAWADGAVTPGRHDTQLMITPGYDFRITGALITNFHLPRSTLLMLVSAFADREFILRAYAEAIEHRYRFYSYGDAMLIV